MKEIVAAPYVTQNAPMEVHQGAEYSQDIQVHRPKVSETESSAPVVDETPSSVDIERNPKPNKLDKAEEHDLSEPLQYVVSAPDAIEKIEGLLEKIEEAWPALKPLVEEVRRKVDEMEAVVWGEEYEAHEAAEEEAHTEAAAPMSQFASGDKVTVALEQETYTGVLTDKNEDGTWEVMTDKQVVLHRVPEEDMMRGEQDSMMLPASQQKAAMALEASLKTLVDAVKTQSVAADQMTFEKLPPRMLDLTLESFIDKLPKKADIAFEKMSEPEKRSLRDIFKPYPQRMSYGALQGLTTKVYQQLERISQARARQAEPTQAPTEVKTPNPGLFKPSQRIYSKSRQAHGTVMATMSDTILVAWDAPAIESTKINISAKFSLQPKEEQTLEQLGEKLEWASDQLKSLALSPDLIAASDIDRAEAILALQFAEKINGENIGTLSSIREHLQVLGQK